MAKYYVFHKHTPENHKEISEAWLKSSRATDQFKGQMSYCSCPSGTHEVFAVVEANSVDEAKRVAPTQVQNELTVSEVIAVPI